MNRNKTVRALIRASRLHIQIALAATISLATVTQTLISARVTTVEACLDGFSALASSGFVSSRATATLKGAVVAPDGAVIPHATLIIWNAKIKRTITANEEGAYSVDLPAGDYAFSSQIPHYFPYRRAKICLTPGSTKIVNVRPLLRDTLHILAVPPTTGGLVEAPSPKYESVTVASGCGPLLIEFERRRSHKQFVEYFGGVATFDALTILADRIRLEKRRLILTASGDDTFVENGLKRVRVKHAQVNFKALDPSASLIAR